MSDLIKVKDKVELRNIIVKGKIPLDNLDISNITDMTGVFKGIAAINGSISNWDVSHVTSMYEMFAFSKFEPDISKWDTSSVKEMFGMFSCSKFNGDISAWNTSKVEDMGIMFFSTPFNVDISSWDVSKVENMAKMFAESEFSNNLGAWDLKYKNILEIFKDSSYSLKQYEEDRINYIYYKQVEKQRLIKEDNDKFIIKTKQEIDVALNREIELSTIEMEF